MASQPQARKQSTAGQQEEGGQAQGHGARGQQGKAMNLEEIGKYRAEAQQRSVDAIRAAEERFNKANQQSRAHGTVAVSQAPRATVISFQEGTNQQEKEEGHGHDSGDHVASGHGASEAKQWLADTASDARDRCNRAMGVETSPTAAHGGGKGPAAQSYAGATAASRAKETKKSSSAEQEGGHDSGHVLKSQGEMGHGRQPDKISDAEAARAAVEKHDKGRKTGAAAGQQQSAKDTASHAVGDTAERTSATDAVARGARTAAEKTQGATQQASGTAVDYTKQTAAKAKDVTAGAAGTTVDYAKQAAVKAKDATVSTGGTAAEYAKAAVEKAREAAKTTATYTQQAAVKAKDGTVATGAQVAQKAKEVTADTAHRVAEYAKEKAEQGKEATARAADQAEEPGSVKTSDSTADKARDVTGRRHEDDTSGDVERRAGGAAAQAKDKVKHATGPVTQTASDNAGRVKDTAKDAAGGVEQRARETATQTRDKARDTASLAEHKAWQPKHRASSETGTAGGGAATRAKGGSGHEEEEEEEEGTTIVGDVLEAVGATVVGLAQHAKGIVAGEEGFVPDEVVEGGEAKIAGAKR